MFQRILVPLDGSHRAERAIPFAARIARATHGSLMLVRVVHAPGDSGVYGAEPGVEVQASSFEKHLANASSYLRTVVATYPHELEGLRVMTDVEAGDSASAIFTAARLEHVDLILLSHHGGKGLAHWVIKSVAQQAVWHSPAPVLVLNEQAILPTSLDSTHVWRALVPLDGSEVAECALEPAALLITALAAPARAELHLLSVIENHSPFPQVPEQARKGAELYLERVLERLQHGRLADLPLSFSSSTTISPDVPTAILQYAGQLPGCDCIAMATHGRSGIQHLLLGSVTEHILNTTPLPLLVVRPPETDAPGRAPALAQYAHSQ